jgi:serine/threonine protein kinase
MRLGRRYGPLVDIYALGCIVYERCTLRSIRYDLNPEKLCGRAGTDGHIPLDPAQEVGDADELLVLRTVLISLDHRS